MRGPTNHFPKVANALRFARFASRQKSSGVRNSLKLEVSGTCLARARGLPGRSTVIVRLACQAMRELGAPSAASQDGRAPLNKNSSVGTEINYEIKLQSFGQSAASHGTLAGRVRLCIYCHLRRSSE